MFDAFVAHHARQRPRAAALMTPRRRVSYAELDADVNRFAAGLRGLGVAPARGVVAVEAASPYHKLVLLLALARLGVASAPTADARADLRLSQRAAAEGAGVLRLTPDWTRIVEAAPPVPVETAPRDPDSLARVMLSPGPNDVPRRVPLSWRRLEANVANGMAVYPTRRDGAWVLRTGIDSGLGFMLAVQAWTVGAMVVSEFETQDLPHVLERQPPGVVGLTPVHLSELLRALPQGFEPRPDWRLAVSGGRLAPAVAREARLRITPDVLVVYGATETGRAAVAPASRLDQAAGVVGWPVPGVEIAIVDAEGRPVPDGESGEVRIRSDRVAPGYLDDPDAGARAFRDGFFRSGDVGRRLPDGALVIEGRLDEQITVQGLTVLPGVLEGALLEHPGVRDVAAVAVPGPGGDDECWIAIVVDAEIPRTDLMTRLNATGRPTPPVRFARTASIPRNPTGKVNRAALRQQLSEALERAGAADS